MPGAQENLDAGLPSVVPQPPNGWQFVDTRAARGRGTVPGGAPRRMRSRNARLDAFYHMTQSSVAAALDPPAGARVRTVSEDSDYASYEGRPEAEAGSVVPQPPSGWQFVDLPVPAVVARGRPRNTRLDDFYSRTLSAVQGASEKGVPLGGPAR